MLLRSMTRNTVFISAFVFALLASVLSGALLFLVPSGGFVGALLFGGLLGISSLGFGAWVAGRLDRAERKTAELTAALARAESSARAGRKAAEAAHEINNPLMLVRENAGWIKDLLEDESFAALPNSVHIRKAADAVERHADRIRGSVRRFLDTARSAAAAPEVLDLNLAAEQAAAFLAGKARANGTALEVFPCAESVHTFAVAGRLEQALLNLLDNAIDAAGASGSTRSEGKAEGVETENSLGKAVSAETAPQQGRVSIAVSRRENFAEIYVRDNGPGIPPDKLQDIFDPFFTTKAAGQGTGLGLAVCRAVMEEAGGSVTAGNLAEGGAEFVLRLPAVEGSAPVFSARE